MLRSGLFGDSPCNGNQRVHREFCVHIWNNEMNPYRTWWLALVRCISCCWRFWLITEKTKRLAPLYAQIRYLCIYGYEAFKKTKFSRFAWLLAEVHRWGKESRWPIPQRFTFVSELCHWLTAFTPTLGFAEIISYEQLWRKSFFMNRCLEADQIGRGRQTYVYSRRKELFATHKEQIAVPKQETDRPHRKNNIKALQATTHAPFNHI